MGIGDIIAVACLVFGFGFVVFFHELGHFLAAKWVGIKVEQFAVGFGHAILSWRKGMGVTWGSSGKKLAELQERGADLSQYGETEYRWNWIPLGGYVKMLGQDDMNPNAHSDDPKSYNRKSVGQRMLVVSAGVTMNVILAAILFMVVFLMGFHVPPAIVGNVMPNSPAQLAGLRVGDRVLYMDGQYQHDFTKLQLNTALVAAGQDIPLKVLRDGKEVDLAVRPQRINSDPNSFLSLGIGPSAILELRGLDAKLIGKVKKANDEPLDPSTEILPGDTITAVDGIPVGQPDPKNPQLDWRTRDYELFDQHVQNSAGKPVVLSVRDPQGKMREVKAQVAFQSFFGETPFNLAGMQPRPQVEDIMENSPVQGKLKRGDVVTALRVNGELRANPGTDQFIRIVNEAGDKGSKVSFTVERDGKREQVGEVVPDFRTGPRKRGVGIGLGMDDRRPIIANVLENSAASRAKIPSGALIVAVDGQPVSNWFDIHALLKKSGGTSTVSYQALDIDGKPIDATPREAKLQLDPQEQKTLANVRYTHGLALAERIDVRQTSHPITAAAWGVTETRDLLLQFYVTLRRLVQGSVSATNLMGPIGIVHAGSLFAFKGWDWLLWFLAMISANLAVVNFLPIPIVDGGLFTFLIIEKLAGRPLSARAQTVAQIVGLAIILSVFLLVTYQDIARIWM
ncbi:MAG: site-2 protease family protein [Bacillota bacterium]